MRVQEFAVMEMAVEQGVRSGWMRAERKIENPTVEQIQEQIITSVINMMCEWFEFDDAEDVSVRLEDEEELEIEPESAVMEGEGR